MRKKYGINHIDIGFNCHKNWTSMEGNKTIRHCKSCNQEVYDFSSASNQEILEFLSNRKYNKTCGRISSTTLKNVNAELVSKGFISYVKSFIAGSIFVTAVSCSTSRHLDYTECDNTTSFIEIRQSDYNRDTSNVNLYSGVVVDCNNIPIIGAHITIDGVQMVYTTDFDGYFHFEQESFIDDNKNVTIQYLGYEDLIISLRDIRNNSVKVVLVSHDFLLGEMVVQYPLRRRVWQRILRIFGLVK